MAEGEPRATEPSPGPGPTEPPPHVGPPPEIQRRIHRYAYGYLAGAVVLVPWIVYLAVTLPKRQVDVHSSSWPSP
jgi:hypothetical protein